MAFNESSVSSTSHERSRQAAIRKFADQAAEKVKGAGTYLRDRPIRDVWIDARKYAVSKPGPALAGAVIVGFLAGLLIRRARG